MKYLTKDTRRKLISYCLRLLPSLGCAGASILTVVWAVHSGYDSNNLYFTHFCIDIAMMLLLPHWDEPLRKGIKITAIVFIAVAVLLFLIDLLVYYKRASGL